MWCEPKLPAPECAVGAYCPVLCGVYRGEWSPEMTAQVFEARGRYTSPNYVADVPQGAARVAQNLVVARPGIWETHRGLERLPGGFPGGTDVISVTEYKGYLIGYSGSGVLARYSGGTWTAYDGVFLPPDGPLTDDEGELIPGKVLFYETSGELYFTTSKGVFRLESPESEPVLSGVVQAFAGTTTLSVGVGTALPPASAFAYRYVWGKRTLTGRLILGAPSGRILVYNTSTTDAKDVIHVVPVPDEARATPGYFLQVYRSDTFPLGVPPDDEMALDFEQAVQDMPVTGDYTFTDIEPEPRGSAAYFAPTVGALQDSKFRPPLATDAVAYAESTVYLNAKSTQSLDLTLLGVDGPNALNVGNGLLFTFADGTTERYVADYPTATPPDEFVVDRSSDLSPSQKTTKTAMDLVRAISTRPGGRLFGYYVSDDAGAPGMIRVEARALDEGPFQVSAIESGTMWAPALPGELRIATGQLSRNGSGIVTAFVSPTFAGSASGLQVGQVIELLNEFTNPTDAINFPPGLKTITAVPTNDSFRYAEAGPVATSLSATKIRTLGAIESERDEFSVAWTPIGEADAVPVINNAQAGNPDLPVLRALRLDNSLYLLKRDGLFRLSGTTPSTFSVDAVDTTVTFIAPWAAFTLGGRAYALTTEGLKVWTESAKPQPASVPIESELLDAISKYRQAVDNASFAVNYESERRLYLFMPRSEEDTSARFAHVYSYLTDTWTTWETPANTAIISPELNRIVLAPPDASQLLRERKTRTNADFQGPDGEAIPVVLEYQAQYGGSTVDYKHWTRFYWHFEGNSPTLVTNSWTTEITLTPQSFTVPQEATVTPGVLEVLVPPECARSRYLYSRIFHSVAQEPFRLLGYSVRHRNYRPM